MALNQFESVSRSLLIFTVLISMVESKEKRMIWAKELRDRDAYDVIGYYAYIAQGYRCNSLVRIVKQLFNMYDICSPLPSHLICGGAMIMPNIVQTACHCVARSVEVNRSYWLMEPKNHWESLVTVFHGYTVVSDMIDEGVWSSKFWVHQRCVRLTYGVSHDYALILLNQPVIMRRPFLRIAPVYTKNELASEYTRTVQRESVCLHVGFGSYNWLAPGVAGEPSPIMMHGWRLLKSYWWCYWELFVSLGRVKYEVHGPSYENIATWSCTTFFGKERAHVMRGDSGSPVVCSSQYFGLNSFGVTMKPTRNISLKAFGALAYAIFENAVEYRKSLVAKLMETAEQEQKIAPTFRPDLSKFYNIRVELLEETTTASPARHALSRARATTRTYTALFSITILLFGIT